MKEIFSFAELFIDALAAEAIGVGFIVGAVVALLGVAFVALFSLSRATGYRTTGTVVGGVERVRIKKREREGEVVEEEKRTLYPVYEYVASDGSRRQMQGSEGGTMAHGYTTGQSVNLIVREDDGYDDVYDADAYGSLYAGLTLAAVGAGIMIWAGSIASAFGVTFLACVIAGVLRLVIGLTANKKNAPRDRAARKPYSKTFDPADLQPIESFAR